MLLPHELKKDNFTKVMVRGYSTVEVDEYLDFVIEKYEELYRENDELERKLKAALVKLDESHSNEDELKNTIVNARHAADKIIHEANERSDILVEAAMNRCNAILSDFASKIKKSKEAIALMKKEVDVFKTALYVKYNDHIEELEAMTSFLESSGSISSYTSNVIEGIKHDLEETIARDPEEYFIERNGYSRPASSEFADSGYISDDVQETDNSESTDESEDFEIFEESEANAFYDYNADDITGSEDTDDGDDSFGGTPDGDFVPEHDDYLYEDDEPFTHTSDHPVVNGRADAAETDSEEDDTEEYDDDEDAEDFAAQAKSSFFGKKNNNNSGNDNSGDKKHNSRGKGDPLSLTDEFELVYSNDDDILG